ncbi:MAG: TetR/AcrR family transcriptional regulator [Myxococcota bacterium]|jgi:AcrR family transcriptional regulator
MADLTRRQQMDARRERILETARGLIESRGYEGLTMRDLAGSSGVTVPTVYNLVGSKEEVLFAAVKEQTRRFVADLQRARGDLIAVVDATVSQLLRRPRYYRALVLVLLGAELTDPSRRHVAGAVAREIAIALDELFEAGDLAPWVDLAALGERLHAHLDMTSIEWARGGLSAAALRAAARFEAATTMLGVTSGTSHVAFEKIARESQGDALRRRRRVAA